MTVPDISLPAPVADDDDDRSFFPLPVQELSDLLTSHSASLEFTTDLWSSTSEIPARGSHNSATLWLSLTRASGGESRSQVQAGPTESARSAKVEYWFPLSHLRNALEDSLPGAIALAAEWDRAGRSSDGWDETGATWKHQTITLAYKRPFGMVFPAKGTAPGSKRRSYLAMKGSTTAVTDEETAEAQPSEQNGNEEATDAEGVDNKDETETKTQGGDLGMMVLVTYTPAPTRPISFEAGSANEQ